MARVVMERLIKDGNFTRGFLGVSIQPVTPDLAKAFNLPTETGALVGGVSPNSPARDAGLKEGDVVIEFNGKKVTDHRQFRLIVSQTPPETKAMLKVLRDGKEKTLSATLAELPANELASRGTQDGSGKRGDAIDGVQLSKLDASTQRQYFVPGDLRGALVTKVEPGSAAYAAGLRPGDVILEINRHPVTDVDDAMNQARSAKVGSLLLRVWSQGGSRYVVLEATKPTR
jgi:serine protease Do